MESLSNVAQDTLLGRNSEGFLCIFEMTITVESLRSQLNASTAAAIMKPTAG